MACNMDCDHCPCPHVTRCAVCWALLCTVVDGKCKILGHYYDGAVKCKDCYQRPNGCKDDQARLENVDL